MINQRLLLLRKTLNLSQEEFASKIGMKRSSICDLEHSRYNLSESNKILICQIFNVNREWLETRQSVKCLLILILFLTNLLLFLIH